MALDWEKAKERDRLRVDRSAVGVDPKRGLAKLKFREQALKGMPKASRLGKCPECGKQMKLRNGKNGMFAGCSGYPNCKHTENVTKGR